MSEAPPWEEPEDLQPPVEEPPLTQEEAADAGAKLVEAAKAGVITTAAKLKDAQDEEVPPRATGPSGPDPPGDLKFDFAYERTVIPFHAADIEREKIRDRTGLVPLPLGSEAVAEWTKSQAIWLNWRLKGGQQDYDYLFKKGHVGALAHLYPDHTAPAFAELLTRHGFTEAQAVKESRRRADRIATEQSQHPAVVELSANEVRHFEMKDAFARAYVAARKKKDA